MTKIVPWNGIPITSLAILFVAFPYCDPSGLDITSFHRSRKRFREVMICPSLDSYPGLSGSKLQTVSLYQNNNETKLN